MSERDELIKEAQKFRRRNDAAIKAVYATRESKGDLARLADFAFEQIQAERKRIAADMQSLFTDNSHDPMQTYDEFWKYLAKLEAK